MVKKYYRKLKNRIKQSLLKARLRKRCSIGKNCYVASDVVIGSNCIISNRVYIGNNVNLSEGVFVGSNAILRNISIGKNSKIEGGVVCTGNGKGKIIIGGESYIGPEVILDWSENITIGSYVHIANRSILSTHSSAKKAISGIPLKDNSDKFRPTNPIKIEDNVYVAGYCQINPGITIGHHSIVGNNSVVTKNVPPYTMVGGVPAKFVKSTKGLILT